jgi:hypothetical protein
MVKAAASKEGKKAEAAASMEGIEAEAAVSMEDNLSEEYTLEDTEAKEYTLEDTMAVARQLKAVKPNILAIETQYFEYFRYYYFD